MLRDFPSFVKPPPPHLSHDDCKSKLENDRPRHAVFVQVLMAIGFVFIGTAGGALLVDDAGVQRLAAAEVDGVMSP